MIFFCIILLLWKFEMLFFKFLYFVNRILLMFWSLKLNLFIFLFIFFDIWFLINVNNFNIFFLLKIDEELDVVLFFVLVFFLVLLLELMLIDFNVRVNMFNELWFYGVSDVVFGIFVCFVIIINFVLSFFRFVELLMFFLMLLEDLIIFNGLKRFVFMCVFRFWISFFLNVIFSLFFELRIEGIIFLVRFFI